MSDDDLNVVDLALDLFVYAPLGFALDARELIPKLAERGRGQIALARVLGRFAVHQGHHEVGKLVDAAVSGLIDTWSPSPRVGDPPAPAQTTEASSPLPIADYDQRPAAEIVKLLTDLDSAQRDVVGVYEADHRGRVTILNRIAQLR